MPKSRTIEMSLRGVHVVFITAATLLSLVMAAWCYDQYRAVGSTGFLASSAAAVLAAVGLVTYGVWFLGKTRRAR
jgi:hypothetical protein